jgi:hypothetical protein
LGGFKCCGGGCLKEDPDALIWSCESKGVYSSHSFYAIINYRGVKPIYIPAIWNIVVPPKIQLFLWLLSHNKLATIDNLNRKGFAKPTQCCFCNENESVICLFFECAVARAIWDYVQKFLGTDIGSSYVLVASKLLQKEKCYVINIISYVALRLSAMLYGKQNTTPGIE